MDDGQSTAIEPVSDPEVGRALVYAARQLAGIKPYTAQSELEALSPNTAFTGIDVYEDSIFRTPDGFFAPATIYVELNYGDKRAKRVISDSFPARIVFTMDGDKVTITDITADTTSFFAGNPP